ncbi:pilus assembly PilX family protein [Synechocystis salina]|uniref:Pilus assembly PilX N-terminal domain-containing protein n=1 Tax=Synechocystis salina LEGE 00031 TaxID=1828736 RepID=A0ABR9VTM0_9SYNC|nr:pilus assembly PilX N-terminal domain-containing protein [Synechocystis salina]MBE9241351.1 pilus assembly PilX N-terminal domain-containing protein [Synechocystis salina LEGE 00041]MBE9254704.1 pilus assembly PilX N-terminal domain-containing protein [Synechocystis salina LEGE 00031]
MNPHKFFRFIILSYRRPADNGGFALPMAIMVGLVLTIIGVVIMQRSMFQQNNSTSKAATDQAQNAAEAGITKLINLMNTPANRFIAALPDCQNWNSGSSTCSDTDSTPSWHNLPNLGSWTITTPGAACQPRVTTTTDITATVSNRAWKTLPQGEFRLVSYQYTPDTANGGAIGLGPGTGTLVVEGAINRNAAAANEARSRLEVKIPITRLPNNASVSSLWVTETATGDEIVAGNQDVYSDIIVNDCNASVDPADFPNSEVAIGTYEAMYSNVPQPDLPPYPACPASNTFATLSGSMTLPRSTDASTNMTLNDGTTLPAYVYCINKIALGGNDTVNVKTVNPTTGQRFLVMMHVKGDMNVSGNTHLNHSCSGTCTNYKPTDLNIFGYGEAAYSSSPPRILASGGNNIEAFILAPDYVYGVNGGGNDGGVTGSLIIKKVINSSSSNQMIFSDISGLTWEELVNTIKAPPSAPNLNPISSWSTKPTN